MKYIDVANNANFYTSEFSTPSAPKINISMSTITSTQMEETADTYLANANTYVNTYKTQVAQKEYNIDMMRKGICANEDVDLATIDLVANTYTANVKADNYFAVASADVNLTNTDGINSVFEKIKTLASELFILTDDDKIQLDNPDAEDAIKALMLGAVTYDTRFVKVDISSIKPSYTTELTFINMKPNATGEDIILSAFATVVENEAEVTKKIFTIRKTNINKVSSWVLAEVSEVEGVEQETNIATITEDIATIEKGKSAVLTFTAIEVAQ